LASPVPLPSIPILQLAPAFLLVLYQKLINLSVSPAIILTSAVILLLPLSLRYAELKSGISAATNALKVGAAASPVVGPASTTFLFWLPNLAKLRVPLLMLEAFKEVNEAPEPVNEVAYTFAHL